MKRILFAAAFAVASSLVALSGAQAQDQPVTEGAQPTEQHCKTDCGTHYKNVRVRGRQIGEKTVPVFEYHTKKVKVKDDCCQPPPKETKIETPPPETRYVEKKIYVVERPKIIHVPARISVMPGRCCPPGQERQTGLPACPGAVGPSASLSGKIGTCENGEPTNRPRPINGEWIPKINPRSGQCTWWNAAGLTPIYQ